MADIVLSAPVRSNLLALQNTAKLLGKTQERLATGLKVNSALDDPNAFFTAAALDARAGDLNRLLDTVDLAVQTIKAADQGISAITKLVESAQALARQALLIPSSPNATVTGTGAAVAADVPATVTGTTATLLTDQVQITTGAGTFDTSGGAGSFTVNGFTVNYALNDTGITVANAIGTATGGAVTATFNGSNQLVLTATDPDTPITLGGANLAAVGLNTTTATQAQRNLLTQGAATVGQTLTVTVGSGSTQTITFGNGAGQVSTLAELNTALAGLTGLSSASVNTTNGNISLTAANAADDIVIGGTATVANFGLTAGTIEPTNASLGAIANGDTLTIQIGTNTQTVVFGNNDGAGQVNTKAELDARLAAIQTAFGAGTTVSADANGNLTVTSNNVTDSITLGTTGALALTTFGTNLNTTPVPPGAASTQRTNLATQYAAVLDQITQLARDASFNGTNLINSDNLIVIFNESNTSSLTITGVDFTATGLGLTAAAGNFQLNTEVNTTLSSLDNALRTLRAQAGTFGSSLSIVEVRKDFTKNLINTLETGSANLKIADSNEEGANLLALQTRQSLSSTALSLASQADQNVLRLFQ